MFEKSKFWGGRAVEGVCVGVEVWGWGWGWVGAKKVVRGEREGCNLRFSSTAEQP